jgi:Uma2 family endonuclease
MDQVRERHRFSVADYHKLGEVGVLTADDRAELLDGEIVDMSPIGSLHAGTVEMIADRLRQRSGGRVQVRVQNPVWLDPHSEPQPDISVVEPRQDYYLSAHPTPEDVLLLIEVADSSAADDRSRKLPLYARAGIREVWLIDLTGMRIEVHCDPAQGRYGTARHVLPGEMLAPVALPGISLPAADLLPVQGQ